MHRFDSPFDPPTGDGPSGPAPGRPPRDNFGATGDPGNLRGPGREGGPDENPDGSPGRDSLASEPPPGNGRDRRAERRESGGERGSERRRQAGPDDSDDADDPVGLPPGQEPPAPRLRPEEAYAPLLRRARFLPESDRALLDLALKGRVSRREIAALMKLPPGTVTRRLQRLARRLHDPLVVALIERPGCLPEEYRVIGIEYFLQKLTLSQLADLHRLSRAQVQQMIHFVRGWFAGSRER